MKKSNIPTPHIELDDLSKIAKTVLMPGDPLRAKFIAEKYLTDCVKINTVRNMFGYTGKYNGTLVTVMGSGMGMASIGIYSYELFAFYGVENIIRIGSAGSYKEDLKVYDCVLASEAYSESSFAKVLEVSESDTLYPSSSLNEVILKSAQELKIPLSLGSIHSSDVFYRSPLKEKKCSCVEMESFALFANAIKLGKNAACLLTISDNLVTHEATTSLERQESFDKMMLIALNTIKYL
jgi:purine-nucleoside phosphorylase